ncbi:MAG: ribosomal protein S18-alanine N-acetyltransferase [Clostridia bacterium]|nr:ribosomal protein S18-alanine N-acetyltransferase [Clostridia bacterium]
MNNIKLDNIKIEVMTLDDLESIKDILASDFDKFWNYNVFKSELQSENSKYLVAKLNTEIIGFAGIIIILDEADVMNIVIKKIYRNQGVGTLLLNEIILLCKKLNLNSISLEVNEINSSAIHLYENFGFKKVGNRKNYYNSSNAILMTKGLN